MNLLSSDYILLYSIGVMAILWASIYVLTKRQRVRQWLAYSSMLGGMLLPVIFTSARIDISQISLFNHPLNWGELFVVSGLCWGVLSTVLQSIGKIAPSAFPIRVAWLHVVITYAIVAGSALIANLASMPYAIILVFAIGLLVIILGTTNYKLLFKSLLVGVGTLVVAVATSYGLTYFTPALTQHTLYTINSVLNFESLVLAGVLGMAATIISRWWLNQPLQDPVN